MSSSPTPMFDAFMKTPELQDEFDGLTAEQIRSMPLSEFGRRTNREFLPASNAVVARKLDPVLVDYLDNAALSEEIPGAEIQQPEPVSVRDMTPEQYAEFRKQIGIGQSSQYGRGILDGASSQSEAYRAAASKQAGRNAMVTGNVIPSPQIARPNLVGVDRPNLDARPLAERFGTASNAFRYE